MIWLCSQLYESVIHIHIVLNKNDCFLNNNNNNQYPADALLKLLYEIGGCSNLSINTKQTHTRWLYHSTFSDFIDPKQNYTLFVYYSQNKNSISII